MSERQIYHLRRIGPAATKPGVVDVMDFDRVTYMIGRSPNMVDYVIDSSNQMMSMFISRSHARIVRQDGNRHKLYDDSLNGVFVNNIKIAGSCVLQEGDRVTFGHPTGNKLPPGIRVRQPDSEYQFLFEECSCGKGRTTDKSQTQSVRQPLRTRKQQGESSKSEMTCSPAKKQKVDSAGAAYRKTFKIPKLHKTDNNRENTKSKRQLETDAGLSVTIERSQAHTDENSCTSLPQKCSKGEDKETTEETVIKYTTAKVKEHIGTNHTDMRESSNIASDKDNEANNVASEKENEGNAKSKFVDITVTCNSAKDLKQGFSELSTKEETELKEFSENESDNLETGSLSEEHKDAETYHKKPICIENDDVLHSPILKEAQRLYDLVRDLNKSFNKSELKENVINKDETKSSTGVMNCKKELYCSDDDNQERRQSKSIAVQTSPNQLLLKDSTQFEVSEPSSQRSMAESEVSEGNDSECSSALETDSSVVSEAQTLVLELYPTDSENNDIRGSVLKCSDKSTVIEGSMKPKYAENTYTRNMDEADITASVVIEDAVKESVKSTEINKDETHTMQPIQLQVALDTADSLESETDESMVNIVTIKDTEGISESSDAEPCNKITLVASDSVEYDIDIDDESDMEGISDTEEKTVASTEELVEGNEADIAHTENVQELQKEALCEDQFIDETNLKNETSSEFAENSVVNTDIDIHIGLSEAENLKILESEVESELVEIINSQKLTKIEMANDTELNNDVSDYTQNQNEEAVLNNVESSKLLSQDQNISVQYNAENLANSHKHESDMLGQDENIVDESILASEDENNSDLLEEPSIMLSETVDYDGQADMQADEAADSGTKDAESEEQEIVGENDRDNEQIEISCILNIENSTSSSAYVNEKAEVNVSISISVIEEVPHDDSETKENGKDTEEKSRFEDNLSENNENSYKKENHIVSESQLSLVDSKSCDRHPQNGSYFLTEVNGSADLMLGNGVNGVNIENAKPDSVYYLDQYKTVPNARSDKQVKPYSDQSEIAVSDLPEKDKTCENAVDDRDLNEFNQKGKIAPGLENSLMNQVDFVSVSSLNNTGDLSRTEGVTEVDEHMKGHSTTLISTADNKCLETTKTCVLDQTHSKQISIESEKDRSLDNLEFKEDLKNTFLDGTNAMCVKKINSEREVEDMLNENSNSNEDNKLTDEHTVQINTVTSEAFDKIENNFENLDSAGKESPVASKMILAKVNEYEKDTDKIPDENSIVMEMKNMSHSNDQNDYIKFIQPFENCCETSKIDKINVSEYTLLIEESSELDQNLNMTENTDETKLIKINTQVGENNKTDVQNVILVGESNEQVKRNHENLADIEETDVILKGPSLITIATDMETLDEKDKLNEYEERQDDVYTENHRKQTEMDTEHNTDSSKTIMDHENTDTDLFHDKSEKAVSLHLNKNENANVCNKVETPVCDLDRPEVEKTEGKFEEPAMNMDSEVVEMAREPEMSDAETTIRISGRVQDYSCYFDTETDQMKIQEIIVRQQNDLALSQVEDKKQQMKLDDKHHDRRNLHGSSSKAVSYSYQTFCTPEEESFKFKSPVRYDEYGEKNLTVVSSYERYSSGEEDSFVDNSLEQCVDVETGLEVIACSVLENSAEDLNENFNEIRTHEAEINNQKCSINDNCTEDISEDIMDVCETEELNPRSYKAQADCHKSEEAGIEESRSSMENVLEYRNRKRKLYERDENCDYESDRPKKVLCNQERYAVSDVDDAIRKRIDKKTVTTELKQHLFMFLKFRKRYEMAKGTKNCNKRVVDMKRNIKIFFDFRDRYNKIKAQPSSLVRHETIGRLVKHFFKLWSPKKQHGSMLAQNIFYYDPSIGTKGNTKLKRIRNIPIDVEMTGASKYLDNKHEKENSVPLAFPETAKDYANLHTSDIQVPVQKEYLEEPQEVVDGIINDIVDKINEPDNTAEDKTWVVDEILSDSLVDVSSEDFVCKKNDNQEKDIADVTDKSSTSVCCLDISKVDSSDYEFLRKTANAAQNQNGNELTESKIPVTDENRSVAEQLNDYPVSLSGCLEHENTLSLNFQSGKEHRTALTTNQNLEEINGIDELEKCVVNSNISGDVNTDKNAVKACDKQDNIKYKVENPTEHQKHVTIINENDTMSQEIDINVKETHQAKCTDDEKNDSDDEEDPNDMDERTETTEIDEDDDSDDETTEKTKDDEISELTIDDDSDDESFKMDDDDENDDDQNMDDSSDDDKDNDNDSLGENNATDNNDQEHETDIDPENHNNKYDEENNHQTDEKGKDVSEKNSDKTEMSSDANTEEKETSEKEDNESSENDEDSGDEISELTKDNDIDDVTSELTKDDDSDDESSKMDKDDENDDDKNMDDLSDDDKDNDNDSLGENNATDNNDQEHETDMDPENHNNKYDEENNHQTDEKGKDVSEENSDKTEMSSDANTEEKETTEKEDNESSENEENDITSSSISSTPEKSDNWVNTGHHRTLFQQQQQLQQLSCQFTDSEDEGFSPVIKMTCFSEDSDEDIPCGQRQEKVDEVVKLIRPTCGVESPSSEEDITREYNEKEVAENSTDSYDEDSDSEKEAADSAKYDDDEMSQIIKKCPESIDTDFFSDIDLHYKDKGNDDDDDGFEDNDSDDNWLSFGNNDVPPVQTDSSDTDENDNFSISSDKIDIIEAEDDSELDSEKSPEEDIVQNSDSNLENDLLEETYQTGPADKIRTPAKRKCNFEEMMSPKIARFDNKGMSDERCDQTFQDSEVFKCPRTSPLMSNGRRAVEISDMACHSPGAFSSTQMLCGSQQPDLEDLSMSQMTTVARQLEVKAQDKSRSAYTRKRAREFLAKIKAKKEMVETITEECNDSPSLSQEDPPAKSNGRSETEVALIKDEEHFKSAEKVIKDLKMAFQTDSLKNNSRIKAWSQELSTIEQKLAMPKTVIAVVGGTGEGKSSLMNALLDHRSVLPTSGIRACTAVVVEVAQNTNKEFYEADIEFLQKKEWFEELQILLSDLSGPNGDVRTRMPDCTSDTYVSYCKVKAVYGKIDKFDVLSRMTAITRYLGQVKTVKSQNPEEFRLKVEKYIQTKDHDAGMQYWPIVKHVRLRMPNCDVLSSGAVLVDLPGVRDSNAARDRIAKEYLKNCTAVWVVSRIHRAIDDKTAKTLLGESFRRQLLMDGQYGSIAFICSQTDVLTPSEIVSNLKLETQTQEIEDRIKAMEQEKVSLERESFDCRKDIRARGLKKAVKSLKEETEMIQSMISEISSLHPIDVDSDQSEDNGVIEELKGELISKETQLAETEQQIRDKEYRIDQCEKLIAEIETKVVVERKEIAAVCARARNEYARVEIKKDFKAGLKEMKRQASGAANEELDDYDDDKDDDNGSSADNLQVFCCSATEYQKMKNLIRKDGPSQIFNSIEDTEVPRLRNYVHEMTRVRRRQGLERLIRSLGRFVFDLYYYMADNRVMTTSSRRDPGSTMDLFIQKCRSSLVPVMELLSDDIEEAFDQTIRSKLDTGSEKAKQTADQTCTLWGARKNTDKASDSPSGRKSVGLCFPTYKATINRQGVYKSPTYGQINFNEDLVDPIYQCLTIVWDKVFNGLLWKALEKVKERILPKLKDFLTQIGLELQELGVPDGARVCSQLQVSADHKLREMIMQLKEFVSERQREISRLITPHVQEKLTNTYDRCGMENGPGTFQRMKDILSATIDKKKNTMFHSAAQHLMGSLLQLKNDIVEHVKKVVEILLQDLKTMFQPLWEAPTGHKTLQTKLKNPLGQACSAVREIYRLAGLTNTEEQLAIPPQRNESVVSSSSTAQRNQSVVSSASTTQRNQPFVSGIRKTECHFVSAEGTAQSCSISLLTGRKYNTAGTQVLTFNQGASLPSANVKEEPQVPYRRTPEGQGYPMGQKLRVVQVKQESLEYTSTEFDANIPIARFGQDTLEKLSKGNLELLPVPPQNQTSQPVLNPARVLPLGPCQLDSRKQSASQSDNKVESKAVSLTSNVTGSKAVSETGLKKITVTGSLGRRENSLQRPTSVSHSEENLRKEQSSAIERRQSLKRGRFEDRLERLSQNFNSSPEEEPSSSKNLNQTKSAVPMSANTCPIRSERMAQSSQKTFLEKATKFGAKLSSSFEKRNSLPEKKGGWNEVSDSDTDSEMGRQSGHKKGRQSRSSLSLSRKGTPQKNFPLKQPSEIKLEPEDDGYPGRRKKSKLCDFIDLTEDESD